MRLIELARYALAAICLLAASLVGSDAAAGWPNAEPAQPLVQAPRICAAGVVPINRRCHVIDFARIGAFDHHVWYYAFYATHWADRHGKMDRGFPVVFYLQKPATLRLSLWIDDAPGLAGRWARKPPPRPVLIQRAEATYLGFSLKAVRGPDDQRLFRLDGRHWRPVNVLRRTDADRALIARATPAACSPVDDGLYDWTAFQLRMALRAEGGGPCGTLVADVAPRHGRLNLTKAVVIR
jgi:hypothetical protein